MDKKGPKKYKSDAYHLSKEISTSLVDHIFVEDLYAANNNFFMVFLAILADYYWEEYKESSEYEKRYYDFATDMMKTMMIKIITKRRLRKKLLRADNTYRKETEIDFSQTQN
jgi:hypothetical protein